MTRWWSWHSRNSTLLSLNSNTTFTITLMNLQKLMKQAQAMQANMANAQARLAEKEFTAEAAGGKIKVTANGTGMVTALSIDASVVDPDDAEFLQSLLLKAIQDALNGSKEMAEKEMRKVTGGLGFPM